MMQITDKYLKELRIDFEIDCERCIPDAMVELIVATRKLEGIEVELIIQFARNQITHISLTTLKENKKNNMLINAIGLGSSFTPHQMIKLIKRMY